MKFIHTADLHLGRPFTALGDKGDELREALLDALKRAVELVREEGADFLVIAGDLFDSNEVTGRLVKRALEILRGIAPTPVLILPGTHDLLDEGSVYHRNEFREAGNVKVFGLHGSTIRIGEAAVHGRANDTKRGGVHPLGELKPDPEARYNIAVVHASVEIEGKASPDDYLVNPEEIASSGMDYLALGHWHGRGEYSSGGTTAWYCGSPEPTKFGEEGAGSVLLVELSDGPPLVKALPTGKHTWLVRDFDLGMFPPGEPLESEIRSLGGEYVLLRAGIKGLLPEGRELDLEALEERLREHFFHLEINNAGIAYPLDEVESLFPEGTVGSLYVSRLKELIQEAQDEEEKSLLEEALYLGAGYIAGELEVD